VKGYLLDTNAVSGLASGHPRITDRFAALPDGTPLHISVIVLGENEFGSRITTSTDLQVRDDDARWINNLFPFPLPITRHTVQHYGDIRAQLFRDYPPKGKKQNHPERCHDTVTGSDLGIDENDLWMAAQAIEHNLVMVSHDKGLLERIRGSSGKLLDVEDWEK
jgi:tRNA(fMet)-specific endonuclease VapC